MSKRKTEVGKLSLSSPEKQQCIAKDVRQSEEALRQLSMLFPEEKFLGRVPRVVMKHMIYSRIPNRTLVDKEIDELNQTGVIRLFKLGSEEESLAVLFMEQYEELIERKCTDLALAKKFIIKILKQIKEISVEKAVLISAGFTETDIKTIINNCLLTVRTSTTYWFAFPGAGEFMKVYAKGRQNVIRLVKKSKYQQILQNELGQRDMRKTVQLGVQYHIHDIIGADLVICVNTTSGNMLRFSN
ncbi:serine/threonine-protein kinase 19-like [Daphnia carinata]|uniref:serine/threonine-protein kinase 19-like n=1 Tax=Daphnia carinata TaxID=120202 RepID=UPI00257B63B5|nr:serine/threonine-protein kinase 19-like [Daphnia carinata]